MADVGDASTGSVEKTTYMQATFGGKWHWIHSSSDRGKHVPLLAPALTLLILVGYYTSPGPSPEQSAAVFSDFTYRGTGQKPPWYTVFSTLVCHLDQKHLLTNIVNMLFTGVLLELTEGSFRLFCIAWGSQTIAMGLHGAFDERYVVGAGGVVYGLLWAQLALVLLNWGQIPAAWYRLGAMAALFVFDVFGMQWEIAVWAHLGGAMGSVCVGIVLGVNVERLPWELMLNWIGAAMFGLLCAVLLAREQISAGLLALALLVLVLLPWCANEVQLRNRMRAKVTQEPETAPQEPETA